MTTELMDVLRTLFVTAAILALAYLFTRHVAGRSASGGTGRLFRRSMTILEQIPVGKDQKLLLVKVGDDCYLLGCTPGGITCLNRFTREEAERWLSAERQSVTPAAETFEQLLRNKILRQKPDGEGEEKNGRAD